MSQKTKIVLKVLAWQERRTVYNMVYTVDEGKSKMLRAVEEYMKNTRLRYLSRDRYNKKIG